MEECCASGEEGCGNYPVFSSCGFMRASWRRKHFRGCLNTGWLWQRGPGWEVGGGGWDPGAGWAPSRGAPQPPHCRDIFVLAVVRAGVMAIHRPGGKQALQNPLWAMAAHSQGHDPPMSESFLSQPPPAAVLIPLPTWGPTEHPGSGVAVVGGDADCSHSSSPDLAQVPRGGRAC